MLLQGDLSTSPRGTRSGVPHVRVSSELARPVGWVGRMSLGPSLVRVSSAKASWGLRGCGSGVTVGRVATDFGVYAMTLWEGMRRADIGLSLFRTCLSGSSWCVCCVGWC